MTAPPKVHDHPSGAKRCQHCGRGFRGRCPHCDFPHANPQDELNCKTCKPMLKGFYWGFPKAKPTKKRRTLWKRK